MASLWELFVKISGDNSNYKQAMKEAGDHADTFASKWEALDKKLALSAGLLTISGGASLAAKKFEDAGVQIQRATGATGEKLEALEASFKNVYTQTSKSADQVSAALGLISTRTGQTGKDLEALTLASLRLANVHREDVSSVITAETQLFGAWSIAANKQTAAINYLRVASQQTGTPVAKLTQIAAEQAPVLKALGYNWEQTVALVGSFDKAGLPTEKVIAGMSVVLKQFAKDGVQDTAVAWSQLVAKVQSGAITFDDFLKKYGGKSGTYLFQSIRDGKTDTDGLVKSFTDLEQQTAVTSKTLTEKYQIWLHGIESVVSSHKDLIVTLGLIGASGAVGRMTSLFTAAIGPMGVALAKLELFILGLGKMSTDYDVMLSTGILRAGVWAGLAVAIALAAKAMWDLSEAEDAATAQTNQRDASLAKLEKNLRDRGANIDDYAKSYHGGGYGDKGSDEAYVKYLRDLQRIGSTLPPVPVVAGPNDGTPKPLGGGLTGGDLAAGDKTHWAKDMSDDLAVLVAREHEEQAAHKATIADIARSGLTIKEYWQKGLDDADDSLDKFYSDTYRGGPEVLDMFSALAKPIDECDKLIAKLGGTVKEAAEKALRNSPFGQLAESAEYFGITTAHAYDLTAKAATEKYDQMLKSGLATTRELAVAELKAAQAHIDADYAAMTMDDARYESESKRIQANLALVTGAEKKKATLNDQIAAETKRLTASMFRSIESGIASDIIHWKGFGETIKGVFQSLGQSVLQIMLHAMLAPLESAFAAVITGLAVKLAEFFGLTAAKAGTTDTAEVAGQAAVGGAGAAAAAAPLFWWNPAIAVGIGAAMAGAIGGTFGPLAAVAFAEKGMGDVPFDNMPFRLHKKEMVLPADIATPLRAQLRSGGVGSGGFQLHIGTMTGVVKETVNLLATQIVRQARLAGARI